MRKRIYLFFLCFMPFPVFSSYPPNYMEALQLFEKNRFEESLQKIREVFHDHSTSLELRLLAAANYLQLKDYKNAMAHLRYAQKDHPYALEVPLLMAEVFMANQQYQEALKLLGKVSGNTKDTSKALHIRYLIAKAYYHQRNFARSKQILEAILSDDPNYLEAIYLDGLIYLQQRKYDLAEFRWKGLLSHPKVTVPLLVLVYNNLGYVKEIQVSKVPETTQEYKTNIEEAKKYYEFAHKLDPGYPVAQQNRERWLQRNER